MLPIGGSREQPNLIVPLYHLERSELHDLVEHFCGKLGLSQAETAIMAEAAERQFLERMAVKDASKELHARIREQFEFNKLRYGGLRPPRKRHQKSLEAYGSR